MSQGRLIEAGQVSCWNDEQMGWGLWMNVLKREQLIGFRHNGRWEGALSNSAEETLRLTHARHDVPFDSRG